MRWLVLLLVWVGCDSKGSCTGSGCTRADAAHDGNHVVLVDAAVK
jgi:hypothetical protein